MQCYLEATETGQQQGTRGIKDQRTEDRLDDLRKKRSKFLTGKLTSKQEPSLKGYRVALYGWRWPNQLWKIC